MGHPEMKVNSISGVTYAVQDLDRTAAFYESLGFRLGKREDDRLTCYVNWFWVTFVTQDGDGRPGGQKAKQAGKGLGVSLHIKVDDLEDFYQGVLAAGLKPAAEPRQRSAKTRDFELPDPDGYTLVFFEKK